MPVIWNVRSKCDSLLVMGCISVGLNLQCFTITGTDFSTLLQSHFSKLVTVLLANFQFDTAVQFDNQNVLKQTNSFKYHYTFFFSNISLQNTDDISLPFINHCNICYIVQWFLSWTHLYKYKCKDSVCVQQQPIVLTVFIFLDLENISIWYYYINVEHFCLIQ